MPGRGSPPRSPELPHCSLLRAGSGRRQARPPQQAARPREQDPLLLTRGPPLPAAATWAHRGGRGRGWRERGGRRGTTAALATTALRGSSSVVSSARGGWESPSLRPLRPRPPLPRDGENWPGAAASLIAHWPSWWGAQTRLRGGPVKCGQDAVTPAGGPMGGSSHRSAQPHPAGRRLRALPHFRGPGPGVMMRVLEPSWAV